MAGINDFSEVTFFEGDTEIRFFLCHPDIFLSPLRVTPVFFVTPGLFLFV